jgi:enamine deaminase RidA (YjgF/YER057c/UK114 family)
MEDQRTNNQQSQAIRANGQIFVSGQIPADASATLIEGSIGDKTQVCCDNIKAILTAAGSSVSKIVKVNVSRNLRYITRTICDLCDAG